MKTFEKFIQLKEAGLAGGLGGMMPNLGQQATPVSAMQGPKVPQQQVSLSNLGGKIKDTNWHMLHSKFSELSAKFPNSAETQTLGKTLYNTAYSGNMGELRPFAQKYLNAQAAKAV